VRLEEAGLVELLGWPDVTRCWRDHRTGAEDVRKLTGLLPLGRRRIEETAGRRAV